MMLVRCKYCLGRGAVACPVCQASESPLEGCAMESFASVKQVSDASDASRDLDCSSCHGAGVVPCSGCAGSGYVDMPCFA